MLALLALATAPSAAGSSERLPDSALAAGIEIAARELGAQDACLSLDPLPVVPVQSGQTDQIARVLGSVAQASDPSASYLWTPSETRLALSGVHRLTKRRAAGAASCASTISVETPRGSSKIFGMRIVASFRHAAIISRAFVFSWDGSTVAEVRKSDEMITVR